MANLEHAEEQPKHVEPPGEVSACPAPVADAAVVPSFAAACALLSAPYSCLVLNTHRRHVALPPCYLSKKRAGIREELEADLLRFSERYRPLVPLYLGYPTCYSDKPRAALFSEFQEISVNLRTGQW